MPNDYGLSGLALLSYSLTLLLSHIQMHRSPDASVNLNELNV